MNEDFTGLAPMERVITLAANQQGFFSAAQAIDVGMSRNSLSYWVDQGRFVHTLRGIYRLVGFYDERPSDHIFPYWLAFGPEAVASHDSALELHDLSDIIAASVHLTVPRRLRSRTSPPNTKVHTIQEDLTPQEIAHVDGLPVTSVERTIVDCASGTTQPDQIELACRQALEQGMTSDRRLVAAARARGGDAIRLIDRVVKEFNAVPA